VRQEVVQEFLGHESPDMTAMYAKIHDRTLRDEFDRFVDQRVNIYGEFLASEGGAAGGDERWLKQRMRAQALPNGFCGLPMQLQCPHANACLTCDHFSTDRRFLTVHIEQLKSTLELIEVARDRGASRQIEMNERVAHSLERIVGTLERRPEADDNGQQSLPA
jgi:integrase/recombinase XerD